jgi:hypothetical protein
MVVIVLVVAGSVLLFGVIGFISGLVWTLVKFALLIGFIALVVWLVVRNRGER